MTPQEMIHGCWYIVDTGHKWLIRFDRIAKSMIYSSRTYLFNSLSSGYEHNNSTNPFSEFGNIITITPATREEVEALFPGEYNSECSYEIY